MTDLQVQKREIMEDLQESAYNADCTSGNCGYNVSAYWDRDEEIAADVDNESISVEDFLKKYEINLTY